jgi:hypothetical protein
MSTCRTLMDMRIGDHAPWRLKRPYARRMSKAARSRTPPLPSGRGKTCLRPSGRRYVTEPTRYPIDREGTGPTGCPAGRMRDVFIRGSRPWLRRPGAFAQHELSSRENHRDVCTGSLTKVTSRRPGRFTAARNAAGSVHRRTQCGPVGSRPGAMRPGYRPPGGGLQAERPVVTPAAVGGACAGGRREKRIVPSLILPYRRVITSWA